MKYLFYKLRNFSNRNSLQFIVNQRIRQDYPLLYKKVRKKNWRIHAKDALSKPDSWKWIFAFFAIIFLVFGVINLSVYWNFPFKIRFHWFTYDLDTAKNLIDQRVSNVATIIGFTLAVCTLLINNLAEKDKNFQLLFKSVFIYSIIYYALALLSWLLLLSLLKDFFTGKYGYIFINAVILSHSFIVALIIFIGYLFAHLIRFLDSNYLHERYIDNLHINAYFILFEEIIKDEKKQLYEKRLIEIGLKKGNSYNSFFQEKPDLIEISIQKNDNQIIEDVNLDVLNKIFAKITSNKKANIQFYDFNIAGFLLEKTTCNVEKIAENLQNSFLVKKYKNLNKLKYDAFNETINKQAEHLKIAVEKNDLKSLEKCLEFYNSVFSLCYGLPNKEFSILSGRKYELFQVICIALRKNHEQIFQNLIEFVGNHCHKSRENDCRIVFVELTYIIKNLYTRISPEQLTPYLEEVTDILKSLTIPYFYHSYESQHDNKRFFYQECAFKLFVDLVYKTIQPQNNQEISKTLTGFKYVSEKFNSIHENLSGNHYRDEFDLMRLSSKNDLSDAERMKSKEEIEMRLKPYYQSVHASFAIQSWLYFLYRHQLISKDIIKEALQFTTYRFENIQTLIEQYSSIWEADWGYLGLNEWNHEERKINTVYTSPPCRREHWLPYGFVVNVLQNDLNENFNYQEIRTGLSWKYENFSWLFDKFDDPKYQREWLEIIGVELDEYHRRKKHIKEILDLIERQQMLANEQKNTQINLSIPKVINFKEVNFSQFKKHASILSLFDYFGIVAKTSVENTSLKSFGIEQYDNRNYFIEDKYPIILGQGNLGADMGSYANNLFLELLTDSVRKKSAVIHQCKTVSNGYSFVFNYLKDKGYLPNLIIAPVNLLFGERYFEAIPNFKYSAFSIEPKRTLIDAGYIGDDVLVVTLYSDFLQNEFIVCDFNKAFRLTVGESDELIGRILDINVRELTNEEFNNELNNYPEKWSENSTLSKEEITVKIKNKVLVDIWCKLKFEIIDQEAFKVVRVLDI